MHRRWSDWPQPREKRNSCLWILNGNNVLSKKNRFNVSLGAKLHALSCKSQRIKYKVLALMHLLQCIYFNFSVSKSIMFHFKAQVWNLRIFEFVISEYLLHKCVNEVFLREIYFLEKALVWNVLNVFFVFRIFYTIQSKSIFNSFIIIVEIFWFFNYNMKTFTARWSVILIHPKKQYVQHPLNSVYISLTNNRLLIWY